VDLIGPYHGLQAHAALVQLLSAQRQCHGDASIGLRRSNGVSNAMANSAASAAAWRFGGDRVAAAAPLPGCLIRAEHKALTVRAHQAFVITPPASSGAPGCWRVATR
jgi:hypothetical protein